MSSFYRHIFSSSLIPSFSFFTSSKRTQNSFTTIRYILDVLFILMFISIIIYTEAVVHWYPSKEVFLKFFVNLTGKDLCWNEACNCIRKTLQHGCFPVKFAKFLRTSFFTEHFQCLLLFTPPYLHLLAYTYLHLFVYT